MGCKVCMLLPDPASMRLSLEALAHGGSRTSPRSPGPSDPCPPPLAHSDGTGHSLM